MDDVMQVEAALAVELRVLHGPQAGSRLPLEPDEYLLGSSDECAVILAGPRIAPEHAQLSFDGQSVWIRPLQGEVIDTQGQELASETLLALGQPLELGGIWIAVDAVDAAWPSAEALQPPLRQVADHDDDDLDVDDEDDAFADEELSAEDLEAQAAGDEPYPFTQGAEGSGTDLDPAPIMGETRGLQAQSQPTGRSRRWIMIVAGVLVGGMLLALGAVAWTARQAEPMPASAPAPVEAPPKKKQPPPELAALLGKYPRQLSAREDGGEWTVDGILADSAALAAFNEEVAKLDARPQVKIITDEDLLSAASKFLAARNLSGMALLRLESLGGGRLRLVGAAANNEQVTDTIAALRAGVSGLRGVENGVLLPPALRKRFLEKLTLAGLNAKVKVLAEEPELQLSGSLSPDEIRQWEALLLDFNKQYGNVLAINASIGRSRPPLPVDVQVIVGGRTPYIVTADGEHVNMGGDINGHTLSSVSSSEVVFEGSKRLRMGR